MTVAIRDSFNVSLLLILHGHYTVNFTTAMSRC
jgi:hypothetical protein